MQIFLKLIAALLLTTAFAESTLAEAVSAVAQTADLVKSEGGGVPKVIDKVEIAKQLSNPLANMVSVPIQFEYNRGMGMSQQGRDQTFLLQPVAPINLGGGDLFVFRPILAAANLNNVNGFSGFGVSSITFETFYAPNTGSSWIWGIGPYLSTPIDNSGYFGSQQTGAGVSAVVLNRDGPWTYGVLGYQSWSVGGNATYGTQNNLYSQPFIGYTTKEAWTFSANMQALYNYDAHHTSNPLYAGISKLEVFDGHPVQFSLGGMYYLSSIPEGPRGWGARATVTFVFPE